jgi:hypothetical protein
MAVVLNLLRRDIEIIVNTRLALFALEQVAAPAICRP